MAAALGGSLTLAPRVASSPPGNLAPANLVGKAGAGSRIEARVSKVALAMAAGSPVEEAVHASVSGATGGETLPELLTEYMVDMKCEGCVKSVRGKLEPLEGVKAVTVDLSNQVVRVLGTAPVKAISAALEETGRSARLIGQGSLEDFGVSAAVVEFKGPEIHGVVRFAQVSMELARIEATFTGLTPGAHGWSINTYGDLTRGAASTGAIFNPQQQDTEVHKNIFFFLLDSFGNLSQPLGDLGAVVADETGRADFAGTKTGLRVTDLIGRALAIYATADKSVHGIAAAVIARSAGVGENYKKLCSCDGTIIWES
ncbi:copper chaperone for superoxide dismutase, chloroplastic/cytosolic isoform X2 [Selaginella moellendorffii]|uniref:copper chaperone for superoxide dismutase, chloroplastic/cytosolic isoform X2 n=1 Tax=Selaginella moellendorffii TaxID=88036 RepID=UPI000D1CAC3A|nr:copper chaperone for superoxide dismutase, chloroplastic/cytosolic isoform X2 [Selaginella moellendorffii]|eukprot:XP_024518024.1 copper chaperone for superoxide dismutase, chloroplastic/cytosolic isoform X2 [Selaginella moellendorffii]